METLWEYTQNPDMHEQWDLRFSTIKYLPKKHENEAQRFLYTTKIGFGLSVSGEGETVGTRIHNGLRTSSLKFWSDQPISLIKEGSVIGISEVLFGVFLFLFRRTKGIYYLNIGIILFLTLGALVSDPAVFTEPFNPVTLNLSMIILSLIGLITLRDLASASNCNWGIK
jgi:hypothetical protein